DVSARKLVGVPTTVADNVSTFSVSQNGVLAYRNTSAASPRQLVWYDRQGNRTPILDTPPGSSNPRLSPDGTHIVVDTSGGLLRPADLWSIDVARSIPNRVTSDPANEVAGVWSPDATQIVFATARGGPAPFVANRIARRAANGTGDDEVLFDAG